MNHEKPLILLAFFFWFHCYKDLLSQQMKIKTNCLFKKSAVSYFECFLVIVICSVANFELEYFYAKYMVYCIYTVHCE